MNKENIIKTYELLNHDTETEIRLIDPSKDPTNKKPPRNIFIKNKNDFLECCACFEGKYNIYAGINERKTNGTQKEDVISVSTIILDIDPIRTHGIKDDPSTQEELNESLKTAREICAQFKQENEIIPSIAMSGNGIQLWFKIPKYKIDDRNRDEFESRIKTFTNTIQQKYNNSKIKIDQIGDLPRIIKIIGTKSIKGNQTPERPHRESYWIETTHITNKTLLELILNYDINTLTNNTTSKNDLTNRNNILNIFTDEKYRLMFEGIIDEQPSRSEPEFALVCDLIKQFQTKEQIFSIMSLSKTGKWPASTQAYKETTYKNAIDDVRQKKLSNSNQQHIPPQKEQRNTTNKETPDPKIEDACAFILSSIKDGFCDETFQVWITFLNGKEEHFYEVTSQTFEDFIRMQIFKGMGYVRDNWIQPIIKTIESKYRNNQRKLFLRTGWYDNELYYQTSKNSCVVISKNRCELIKSPYIFRTFQTQIDHSIDLTATLTDYTLLEKYTNFTTNEEKELFFDILPAFFIPEISKPIILIKGEAGSAKSTLLKIMKKLIDPNISLEEGISLPKDPKDWYVISRQHYFLFFDNIGKIAPDEQDTCCRIIQGWSMEVRKLFTDNQTVYARLKNCMGINAIELENLQSDFLDRSLIFELKRIPDTKRLGDEQFKQNLNADLPKILGSILKLIQKSLEILPNIQDIPQSLRLLDFVKYSAAISQARGRDPKEFLAALTDKSILQKEESIDQSIIAQPIIKFMEDKKDWSGNTKELITCLLKQEYGEIINEGNYEKTIIGRVPRHFPQDPRLFSKELSKIGFVLKSKDIIMIKKRTGSSRIITLQNEYLQRNNADSVDFTPFKKYDDIK